MNLRKIRQIKKRISRTLRRNHVYFGLILPVFCLIYELLFQSWIADGITFFGLLLPILISGMIGLVLGALVELPPDWRVKRWTFGIVTVLIAAVYLVEYYVHDAYHMFMTPALIFRGAKGVAMDYGDIVVGLLTRDFWRILLMVGPAILVAALAEPKRHRVFFYKVFVIAAAAGMSLCTLLMTTMYADAVTLGKSHDLEGAIRKLGVPAAVLQNLSTDMAVEQDELTIVKVEKPVTVPVQTEPSNVSEESEEEIVYEPNVLPLDFAEMAKKRNNSEINSYIASQEPSLKNEYTGLFAGKNLILITAEAFTKEVIDPQRTPTLYRLATQGIRFTDYYQPAWGGSTTGGEMSNLFGLVPDISGGMMQVTSQKPFITMGRQLMNQGYFSLAFHNNTSSFYDRVATHADIGYSKFITPDEGLQVTGVWPQSDLEMILDSVPRYIDNQPFSVYYMTVSGHSVYEYNSDAMARKNYAVVENLDCSDQVKCYLAANMELEYAMKELVSRLEAAGIADDTVIVLATDHYPYGLDVSRTWNNKQNCLAELFGVSKLDSFIRDHSALIIWSGCLEGKNIVVDEPTFSLDILPTLSNLFGLEFESRLFVGRDVFSEKEPLVFWPNRSWITNKGRYDGITDEFTPNPGVTVDDAYVKWINAEVVNKINFSYSVVRQNYLRTLDHTLQDLKKDHTQP